MSKSRTDQQKAALKQWFKDVLQVEAPKEQREIVKEFCDMTGFKPPRMVNQKSIRPNRYDRWREQWLIARWGQFQLWISSENAKVEKERESSEKQVQTPADGLVGKMITI